MICLKSKYGFVNLCHDMETRTMSYIEQVYRLGLVDANGHLTHPKQ